MLSVGEFLELFESRVRLNARDVECVLFSCGCYGGGWCKAVKNTTDCELELRRQCIEEEEKDQATEFIGGVQDEESWGRGRRGTLQSSGVGSCEKAMATKRASIARSGRRGVRLPVQREEW